MVKFSLPTLGLLLLSTSLAAPLTISESKPNIHLSNNNNSSPQARGVALAAPGLAPGQSLNGNGLNTVVHTDKDKKGEEEASSPSPMAENEKKKRDLTERLSFFADMVLGRDEGKGKVVEVETDKSFNVNAGDKSHNPMKVTSNSKREETSNKVAEANMVKTGNINVGDKSHNPVEEVTKRQIGDDRKIVEANMVKSGNVNVGDESHNPFKGYKRENGKAAEISTTKTGNVNVGDKLPKPLKRQDDSWINGADQADSSQDPPPGVEQSQPQQEATSPAPAPEQKQEETQPAPAPAPEKSEPAPSHNNEGEGSHSTSELGDGTPLDIKMKDSGGVHLFGREPSASPSHDHDHNHDGHGHDHDHDHDHQHKKGVSLSDVGKAVRKAMHDVQVRALSHSEY